ncbi:MAG: ferredoxin family protein [Bacteroidales bacterium]|nr:ferredoxin family protein [Bacteroidales bacterium]
MLFDDEKCTGCNNCVEICQVDVFLPGNEKGGSPVVAFPGECWYCGCCVMVCPSEEAITLRHPLINHVHYMPIKDLIAWE